MDDGILVKKNKIVIPESLIMKRTVTLARIGSQEIEETKSLLRLKVWFPSMHKIVEEEVKHCIPCQATTIQNNRDPVISTELQLDP